MANSVDEIKSRLDIVEVVKEYVQLKQVGPNWKGLSPFTNEKTPSFYVSQDKQLWHCFSSNQGGDMFTFVERMENVDFFEALKILARKANVELENYNPGESNKRNRLLEMQELAAKQWQKNLFSDNGQKARDYIKSRGLTKETVVEWKIGYAPDAWNDVLNNLKNKQFTEEEIIASGLVTKNEKGRIYDRFRERVMFPIADHNGQIVGFTGRLLGNKDGGGTPAVALAKAGKYVNSPQTDLYDKSSVVFGLYYAKQAIKDNDLAVLVEGQMDVLSSYQAGVKNVVASSGTALTEKQLDLVARYTKNIAVAYDQDSAGIKALERSIDLALSKGFNVSVVLLPSGEDPDSLIKLDASKWEEAVQARMGYIDYFFAKIKTTLDLEKISDKKQAAKIVLPVLARLPDRVEQDVYIQRLGKLLSVSSDALRQSLPNIDKTKSKKSNQGIVNSSMVSKADAQVKRLQSIIACAITNLNILEKLAEILQPDDLPDSLEKKLYNELILFYNHLVKSEHSRSLPTEGQEAGSALSQDIYSSLETSILSANEALGKLLQSLKLLSDDLKTSGIDIGREAQTQAIILQRDILQSRLQDLNILLQKNPSDDEILLRINEVNKQLGQLR